MSSLSLRLFAVTISALLVPKGRCFVVLDNAITGSNARTSNIQLRSSPMDGELEDLDRARFAFESMLTQHGEDPQQQLKQLPMRKEDYVPIVTSSCLSRREVEMELLDSLLKTDDAIDELMSLWLTERDYDSFRQLQRMEEICSPGLVQEEALLRRLIDDYGIDWAEPVARLGTLLFFQGRTDESIYWCKVALAVKPWHFETVHTLVLNSLRQGNVAEAIRWRRRGLPPMHQPKKRAAWIKQAKADARDAIIRGQKAEAAKKAALPRAGSSARGGGGGGGNDSWQ